jgi:hypothetical protein
VAADVEVVGTAEGVSARALQPASAAAEMITEATPMRSLRRTGWILVISPPAIRHNGMSGWVLLHHEFRGAQICDQVGMNQSEAARNPNEIGRDICRTYPTLFDPYQAG